MKTDKSDPTAREQKSGQKNEKMQATAKKCQNMFYVLNFQLSAIETNST